MTRNDLILIVLGIVITLCVGGVFLALLVHYVKHRNRLVTVGEYDEEIVKEYEYEHSKKARITGFIGRLFDLLICVLLLAMFFTSVYARVKGDDFALGNIGSVKVVRSESMSKKNANNTYLTENGLDNQFDMYDLIVVNELPAEKDLQLYDIVVYEKEGIQIVHRIIEIEEANAFHPNERWFTLKGDANQAADVKPVLYSQMKAIYTSKKVPFMGVFVLWLQSSLGYLVLLVVLFYLIAEPIAVKSMRKVRDARIAFLRDKKDETPTEEKQEVVSETVVFEPRLVDYPKTTPVVRILRDKFSLDGERAVEKATEQLRKFAEILKLKEAEHPEKFFVENEIIARNLVLDGKIEHYPETDKNGEKIELGERGLNLPKTIKKKVWFAPKTKVKTYFADTVSNPVCF